MFWLKNKKKNFCYAFLHGNSLCEAVWSRKIHVQIMKFTCCLNMAFTWKSLNWALICMHDVTLECVVAMTGHFADAFVRENIARVYMTLWQRNDIRKLTQTPFCFEKASERKGIFFSACFMLKSGKICKNNHHTCLFHCINTCRVPRRMFKHSAWRPRVQTASSGTVKC